MSERWPRDWPTVACQVDAEELRVTHAPEVAAEEARALMSALFASGRVPRTSDGSGMVAISVVGRLWIGTHAGPSGVHLIAIVGSRCVISRALAPSSSDR